MAILSDLLAAGKQDDQHWMQERGLMKILADNEKRIDFHKHQWQIGDPKQQGRRQTSGWVPPEL